MPTKQDVIDAVTATMNQSTVPDEGVLNQEQLTQMTDEIAGTLETVNPDRRYPSTPV